MDWAQFWPMAGGAFTGIAATLGAWGQSRARKRKDEEIRESMREQADRDRQSASLDERSDILRQINEQLLEPLKIELSEVRERLKSAEEKIDHLEDTNDHLVAFIYKLIGMARVHGYDKDILPADVPPGIHL